MNDAATMGGVYTIKVWASPEAKERGDAPIAFTQVHNKMTNASLAVITGLVGNTGAQTAFGYLAVGTDSTAVSASHTALQAEITDTGLARASATISRSTTTQANDTLNFVKEWTASGTKTIEEVGIFNAASNGVMLARATTGTISLLSGHTVEITYSWRVVGN